MTIIHKLSLDMMQPQPPERIHVKQGDTYSRNLQLLLFCDGEPWPIPGDATPVIRWFACNPDTGETAHGIYDTLPNGVHAWNFTNNQLDLALTPQMFALPGLVQADVALVTESSTLATFNFAFSVNPAPADGTEPIAGSFYALTCLGQINEAVAALQSWQTEKDELLALLEQEIFELKRIVNQL